ncbi:hypothetical protein NHF46_14785 [Arthrobacter alpinus]|nr:hypothetical protein [Arthrobacter alpinus]
MVGTAGMVGDTFVQVGQAVTTMAALLDPDAVTSSVKAMAQAAKDAGATLVAITAFARSPWPPWRTSRSWRAWGPEFS